MKRRGVAWFVALLAVAPCGCEQDRFEGRSVGEWRALASDGQGPERRQAVLALWWMADDGRATTGIMVDALADPDPALRTTAAAAIGRARMAGPRVEGALRACLSEDPVEGIRASCADALWKIQPVEPASARAAAAALADPALVVRLNAAAGLGKMSDRAPAILDALERAARDDPHPDVRRSAARSYLLLTGRRLTGPGEARSRR